MCGGGGLPGRPSTFSPHFKLLPSFLYAADIMYLVKNVNGGHLKIFFKIPAKLRFIRKISSSQDIFLDVIKKI